ncbi:MAG TPA: c-type cytochrome [Rhodocyclaceae bacterium]
MKSLSLASLIAAVALLVGAPSAFAAVDEDAANETLDRNDCTKCHDVTKTKKGPSFKKIAAKFKGKADAKEKMLDNVTKQPMVKLEDGTKEKHKRIDTKDPKELDNLFDYILSR